MDRYRLARSSASSAPAEWGEWAHWMVVDELEGVPVGFVWEHHELIAHNTWGPVSYVSSHNPLDADGVGNPVWRADGFDTPQAALRALITQIEGRDGGGS